MNRPPFKDNVSLGLEFTTELPVIEVNPPIVAFSPLGSKVPAALRNIPATVKESVESLSVPLPEWVKLLRGVVALSRFWLVELSKSTVPVPEPKVAVRLLTQSPPTWIAKLLALKAPPA
jgi:hypothetical protein